MNRKSRNLSVSAVVLGLFATCAGAAEPGFYVAASLGMGDEDPESAGINVGNSLGVFHVEPDQVDVDTGKLAWSVGLGYRVNKYLSGEVEYVDFGTTDVAEHDTVDNIGAPVPFPTVFTLDYSSHVTGPALSLLGTLPMGENFELFLRGGAFFGSREFNTSFGTNAKFASTVWLAGAGVTWSFAKRWAIRAEYQQIGKLDESLVSGETELQRMSLSALFRL
jgi:opacity protein-like surface antigen